MPVNLKSVAENYTMYFRTFKIDPHTRVSPVGGAHTLCVGGDAAVFAVVAAAIFMVGCGGQSKKDDGRVAAGAETPGTRYPSPWDKPILREEAAKRPAPKATADQPSDGAWASLLDAAGLSAAGVGVPGAADTGPARSARGVERVGPAPVDVPVVRASRNEWSIVIASFDKERGGPLASEMLRQVQRVSGLSGAYLEERGKALVIGYGRYSDAASARRELDRLRDIVVENERPFRAAVLAPPVFDAIAGSIPEYDLRNAKAMFGKGAAYTLQVGVYGKPGGATATEKEMAEFRAAAERAVVELRREGEEAFYFHGPRRSMVTVGVFSVDEYDANDASRESPRLTLLRQKYPYNLENGAGIRRRRPGQAEARIDPSFIVMVPGG